MQPLTLERLDHLNPKKNPFLKDIEAAYWLVLFDGRPVGRISAQVNQAHLERHQDATGHFGFIEAIDDEEVFGLLIDTAATWLRLRGMERMAGPFSLSINDETGTLVDGFDTPPQMMMPHGQPHYDRRLHEQGLVKAKDLIAFRFDAQAPLPAHRVAAHRTDAKDRRAGDPPARHQPLRPRDRADLRHLQRCLGRQLGLHPLRRRRGPVPGEVDPAAGQRPATSPSPSSTASPSP